MSTIAPTGPARAARTARRDAFAGTSTLVRFMARRDRVRLPAWTAGFGLFMTYLAVAIPAAYETEDDLENISSMFHDPVGRMLVGPGYGFDAPTFERFVANGYGLYVISLSALMSILLVVRHSRVEEQTGRAELVRANVVGRHAALTATLAIAALTNLIVGAAVFLAMIVVGGFGVAGSALFAASVSAVGLAFAGLATITVQLTEYSRAAAGMAGAGLGAAFVLRAGGDMAREGGSALSWTSPLGWGQQTAPFVLDRWWPLTLLVAFAAVTTAMGYQLSARRDLGASMFAVRPGHARARPSLGTPLGLALRLQRAGIVGWSAALVVSGLVYGSFADALLGAVDDMPDVFLDLFGADDVLAGYLGYMAVFMAYLVAVYAILAVQGLRNEETGTRAEPVLATPVSRWAWLGSHLAVVAAGVVVLMAVTGVATGVGAALVTGDVAHVGELTVAHLNHVPSVLVVVGLATLLFGVAPRALPVTWVVVGYALVVGTFGPMLDLPQTAFSVSPFTHPAQLPLETFTATPLVILTLVAAATTGIGLVAFRRRNLDSN